MNQRLYQSHTLGAGMSNSEKKWRRLCVPENLAGYRVLDVGCNEGLLSNWCWERGAKEVIGIDFDAGAIEFAKRQYAKEEVKFFHQRWSTLPDGPFDLVLWTSAMHYERDPRKVIESICQRLSSKGMLILEAGVVQRAGKEMVSYSRHSDVQMYPTRRLIEEEFLQALSFRQVAKPEATIGDPVPRVVYHCRPKVVTVMFIIGPTQSGKSNLAATLLKASSKSMGLDVLLSRVAHDGFHHGGLQNEIRELYDENDLSRIYASVTQGALRGDFIKWLGEFVATSDELVVFEGFVDENLVVDFGRAFPQYRIWLTRRA